ncbi:sugar transferase [Candidatus Pelagibacter sp. HIMB1495]|uniref:sugar transferase n=1 Tax=unclassified Candidatus Pelagibacter TaxID=2647897 RepID=UPI003F87E3F1
MQRVLDIFFSTFAIVIFAPLIIIIILILSFTGEGEIFYKQDRIGKNKKSFKLIKFATMLKNSEKIGSGTVTLKNDVRVLPIGKFLRKTKINEIPQLFNIFLGQMSIIGPRPLHEKQFSFYSEIDQKIISSCRPGLSGVASIIFRDEEKILQNTSNPELTYKKKITPRKAQLEKWYINNQSIYLYFKLIFLTLLAVFFPKINMERFFK